MTPEQRAAILFRTLEKDITDRRGLKSEWYSIDDDIMEELRANWEAMFTIAIRENVQAEREDIARYLDESAYWNNLKGNTIQEQAERDIARYIRNRDI